jgi:pilus assembly protein Flp/PilA
MKNLLLRFVGQDEGQDLIEYALLAAFISLAAVLAIQQLGSAVNTVYTKVSSTLATAS